MLWSPRGFTEYQSRYPATPDLTAALAALPDPGLQDAFAAAWEEPDDTIDDRAREGCRGLRVVFVRGYLGNWMPGNLVAVVDALRAIGVDAHLAKTDTSDTVDGNVERLVAQVGPGPVLLCGHSKGGLECLRLADRGVARVVGILLSQTPRGASRVLESLLLREHQGTLGGPHRRIAESLQRAGLHLIGAPRGGHQLTREPLAALVAELDRPRKFPVWQTASWSSRPTAWLDSFHERLGEIRPGAAHDGQFYLEDLLWPGLPHVLLPHLDHAQPAMGGFGFDAARYWKVLVGSIRTRAPGS